MDKNKSPRDDKLVQELYDKLDWYTFQANDEEFDPKQVQMIVDLLDSLDPMAERGRRKQKTFVREQTDTQASPTGDERFPARNVDEAFERFKKKYNVTDEDLARKDAMPAAENTDGDKIVPFPMEASGELAFTAEEIDQIFESTGFSERKNGLPQAEEAGFAAPSCDGRCVVGEATETNANGTKNRKVRFVPRTWGKIAITFVAVAGMGTMLTLATSAVKQKSFLETVESGINSMRMIVTGNEQEREFVGQDENEVVYYDSWEDVQEENPEVMIPGYIPDGLRLSEISCRDMGNYINFRGVYQKESVSNVLVISIKYFEKEYADLELLRPSDWSLLKEDKKRDIKYYQQEDLFKALWVSEKCIYGVEWINLDEIDNIISKMD